MWLSKVNKVGITIGMITILTISCYKDKEDLLYGNSNCDTTTVSFATDILPIIQNSCATVGCHVMGGSGNGLFENYNQVKAKVDNGSFRQRVIVTKDMPPSSPLSDCQIQHITKWLDNGAPNN